MSLCPVADGHRTPAKRSRSRRSRVAAVLSIPALCVALTASSAGVASASSPRAATLPPGLAEFAHCPVDNPDVTLCLAASDIGTFTINSTTLTETSPIILSLGLIQKNNGSYKAVLPDDGTPAMTAAPIQVPGGLLGTPGSSRRYAVTATPQLVGLPVFSLDNLLTGDGPAMTLPTDVMLRNPLLGKDCTVGSPSDPDTLALTDGTTDPPPPNLPITGSIGTLTVAYGGRVVKTKGTSLVNNSYAVPGASGCGPYGVLDSLVDFVRGLPSVGGTNAAILSGTSGLAEASLIRQKLDLPPAG
jgi:hypothetical protein